MKLYLQNWNNILTDIIPHFEIVKKIEEADKVVLWNEVGFLEQGLIKLAHAYGKPVIVMQHGRRGSSRYFPPFNEKILADKLLVWGSRDKELLVKAGKPEEKIEVVGCPLFKHLKPKEAHEGINIVFSPEHWDTEVDENYQTAYELRKLAKKNGWKITTKIIDGHNQKWYDNPIYSNRNAPEHLGIVADVLKTADIVVGISDSTFELLAQYLDIPVVIMSDWKPKACNGDERYLTYRRFVGYGLKQCKVSELGDCIKSQLNPQVPFDDMRDARKQECIEEGGVNLGDPIENILKAIKNA